MGGGRGNSTLTSHQILLFHEKCHIYVVSIENNITEQLVIKDFQTKKNNNKNQLKIRRRKKLLKMLINEEVKIFF